ncbi:dual specificity protein phosphatase 1-like [Cornus florida]|uniref:dual specificity protein phosphatase 1-like n=1 Tax=Cornus florida TaxID=4283 RepID=UPI0028A0F0BF|nr:dual specificity protein phosphatase 1-like [Cornus florida]
MDEPDEMFRERIKAIWQARYATRCIREDGIPCQIEEGLFLGSLAAANNKRVLKCLNVTHILTVASSMAPAHPDDFKYKTIEVLDREDIHIAQYFNECVEFIEEAKRTGGGVLVHCFVGRSRSVTIVVAYLMKKHGMSVSQALEHVKSRRPMASPNPGFMLQLQNFEKILQGCQVPFFGSYIDFSEVLQHD